MKMIRILTVLALIAAVFAAAAPARAQAGVVALCSGVQLQNATTTDAPNVSLNFYNVTNTTGTADYVLAVSGGLLAGASKSFYIPTQLPSSVPDGIYSVVVNSSQQLNSLVNEDRCNGVTGTYVVASHSGVQASQVGTPVYLAFVLSRAYADGWSSVLAVQNAGTAADATVAVAFYKPGQSTPTASFTTPSALQPGQTWYLDLSTGTYATAALANFSGSAKVTSTQPLAAVANYAPANGSRLLSYNGVVGGSQKLYATQITKRAFSQVFTSGITLYNPNATDTNISMKFYVSGQTTATCTYNDTITANSSYVKNMTAINACSGNGGSGSLPDGFNGYLVIDATPNAIVGIFNFDSGIGQAGSANMIRVEDAATTLFFPQILRNAFGGFGSGFQVVNTGTDDMTIDVLYTKTDNTTYTDHKTIPANSSLTNNVSGAGLAILGDGWNGGVKITVTGGTGKLVGQANIIAPASRGGDTLSVYNAFTP